MRRCSSENASAGRAICFSHFWGLTAFPLVLPPRGLIAGSYPVSRLPRQVNAIAQPEKAPWQQRVSPHLSLFRLPFCGVVYQCHTDWVAGGGGGGFKEMSGLAETVRSYPVCHTVESLYRPLPMCYYTAGEMSPQLNRTGPIRPRWPSGLRRWFANATPRETGFRIPPLPRAEFGRLKLE